MPLNTTPKKSFKPALQLLAAAGVCALPSLASAMPLSQVAINLFSNFAALADLISGGAYLAGAGLGFQAAMKFKAHNDNPQQTKLSQPIVYALVAACLLSLPSFIGTFSDSAYGEGATTTSLTTGTGQSFINAR
jgi:intracellular multiplication protein IcmD